MSWSGEFDEDDVDEDICNDQNTIITIDSYELLEEAEDILRRLEDYIFYHGLDMLNTDDVKFNLMSLIIHSK